MSQPGADRERVAEEHERSDEQPEAHQEGEDLHGFTLAAGRRGDAVLQLAAKPALDIRRHRATI